MKIILFLLVLIALACGGLYATPENPYSAEFESSCFDNNPDHSSFEEVWADQVKRATADTKLKETLLKGHVLADVIRAKNNPLNCLYRFKKSTESLAAIQAKMDSYEKQYDSLLKADHQLAYNKRKLDQNVRIFTKSLRNQYLYEYRTSPYIDKDKYLHVFVANCTYEKGREWDAITRETELNLTLTTTLPSNHFMEHQCLYYFTPDLAKFK